MPKKMLKKHIKQSVDLKNGYKKIMYFVLNYIMEIEEIMENSRHKNTRSIIRKPLRQLIILALVNSQIP